MKVPDLHDLHLLVTVAATGSIGQAAVQLGLTQPSASRRLASLERTLRVQMLHRGTRGTTLTTSGRAVVGWAKVLLQATEDFTGSVEDLGRQEKSLLKAAVSMTIAEYYAPSWLAAVKQASPDTTVTLFMGNSGEVMDLVETQKVDLGLVESPLVRSSLCSRQIGRDRLVIAVRPDHPWAGCELGRTAGEIARAGLLVREPGSGTRDTIERAIAGAGEQFEPGLELASNTALKSAALAGIGPAVLPAIAAAHELLEGELVEVPLVGIDLTRPLTIVWHDAARPSQDALNFFLRAARRDIRTRADASRALEECPAQQAS